MQQCQQHDKTTAAGGSPPRMANRFAVVTT
jgi:hypothetical protein